MSGKNAAKYITIWSVIFISTFLLMCLKAGLRIPCDEGLICPSESLIKSRYEISDILAFGLGMGAVVATTVLLFVLGKRRGK